MTLVSKPINPRNWPHLAPALSMVARGGYGLCIHRACAFVLDVKGADLCFGTLREATPLERLRNPEASDVPFIHAWAELRGMVYAPTLIERVGCLAPIPLGEYYAANAIRDVYRMTRRAVLKVSGDVGLSAHLRKNKPLKGGASFGLSLLDAAGVPYRLDDHSILPASEEQGN